MDVTTKYNSTTMAAVQNNRQAVGSNGAAVAERPTARPLAAAEGAAAAHAPPRTERTQDVYASHLASLREESITDVMLERAFDDANRVLRGGSFRLSYATHEDSGRIMVTVHEAQSDEVLRQIPMESRLDIYARITEFVGLLFDQGN
ncbi:MAG: flagellar protein FlaG [Clostridiales bacterium]|jgi:flagellar protein FlaG|nr:flagellar protein FlaG [Clostridiales bacterium]